MSAKSEAQTEVFEQARALCTAGLLTEVRRVGLPVLDEGSDLELDFLSPEGLKTFTVGTGPIGAGDVRIRLGQSFNLNYAHLLHEDPEEFANIVADWTQHKEIHAAWAVGASLSDPLRLHMNEPYLETVGFSFLCTRAGEVLGRLALIGESDWLYAADVLDSILARYQLKTL